MDNTGLEIFNEIMQRPTRKLKYLSVFPQGEFNDRISELVWGVRSKEGNDEHIYNFVVSNVKNSYKLLTKSILHSFEWDNYFNGTLKNPGLMCEYFLVDYMSRNSHKYELYKGKRFKFFHKKGTPEQDEDLKIDLMTTMVTQNNDGKYFGTNFGVQLSTSKSRAEFSKKSLNGLDWIGYKKGDIYRTSNMITEGQITNYPPSFTPHTMCLLVVNSSINELINIENINIFKNAFSDWKESGLIEGGPTQFLDESVKNDMEKINDGYILGLEIFYKLVSKVIENNRDFKNMKKYDNFDIIFDYDASKKELKMDYFLKDGNFLMSLFFVINENIIKSFNS